MADELEREILAMETRLLEVKLTMEAEKVNWERANKPTKKTGTHWKRAARTPPTSTPPAPVLPTEKPRQPRAPKRSMTALLRRSTSEWNTTDVVAWLEHLQFLELARLAGESGINGSQLLGAHLGLSDLHLRQLFRISLVDSSWKAFVREVASLHRRHVETQQQLPSQPRMTPNDVSLPTIAPPSRKQKRVKKTQPMAACWICAKVCPRPPTNKEAIFYCSVECQVRAQHSQIHVSNHMDNNAMEAPRSTKTPLPRRPKPTGTSSFAPVTAKTRGQGSSPTDAQLVLTSHCLQPPATSLPPPKVHHASALKPPTTNRPRRPRPSPAVQFEVRPSNQASQQHTKYRLDPVMLQARTLSSTFLPVGGDSTKPRHLLYHLLPYLRMGGWSALLVLNRAWHDALASDESGWKIMAAARWAPSGTLDAQLVAEYQSRKPGSWRVALANLTRKCTRIALENVRVLNDAETWTMALANRANLVDELVLLVCTATGAIIGVETSFKLIQAIAPEVSTMDILHRLETQAYARLSVQRLCLFHASRIPLFDEWPAFARRPFATFETPSWRELPMCAAVLQATRRRYRRSLADLLDGLLKRARAHKRKEAIDAIEAMLKG